MSKVFNDGRIPISRLLACPPEARQPRKSIIVSFRHFLNFKLLWDLSRGVKIFKNSF